MIIHIPINTKWQYSALNTQIKTSEKRVLHRKHMSKPICEIVQEPNNRESGPRGPDDRFPESPKLQKYLDSDSDFGDQTCTQQIDATKTTGKTPTHQNSHRNRLEHLEQGGRS